MTKTASTVTEERPSEEGEGRKGRCTASGKGRDITRNSRESGKRAQRIAGEAGLKKTKETTKQKEEEKTLQQQPKRNGARAAGSILSAAEEEKLPCHQELN